MLIKSLKHIVIACCLCLSFATFATQKSKVIIVRNNKVFNPNGTIDNTVLQNMLNIGIKDFYKVDEPQKGWAKAFNPSDRVAIKVNVLAAFYAPISSVYKASTHPELAYDVAKGLISAGIKPDHITIFDRKALQENGQLRNSIYLAGFSTAHAPQGVLIKQGGSYGPVVTLKNGVKVNFLQELYEDNKLINMPILKAHPIMGFTFALKNHLGSFKPADMPLKNSAIPGAAAGVLHKNAGISGIAALDSDPLIKNKQTLIVGDMLRVQTRTQFYDPEGSFAYNGIIIGTDPVAVDTVAWHILQQKRQELGINYFIGVPLYDWYLASNTEKEKFKSFPKHMKYGGTAASYLMNCANAGLGITTLKNIKLKIINLH